MYCPYCGKPNDDNALSCSSCGAEFHEVPPAPQPPYAPVTTYLVPAILVTLFCCIVFGIPAIVFAGQASGRAGAGDMQGAAEAARKAKMWCWIAGITGLLFNLAWFFLMGLSIAMPFIEGFPVNAQ